MKGGHGVQYRVGSFATLVAGAGSPAGGGKLVAIEEALGFGCAGKPTFASARFIKHDSCQPLQLRG